MLKKIPFCRNQCRPVDIIFKYITVFRPSEEGHFIWLKKIYIGRTK